MQIPEVADEYGISEEDVYNCLRYAARRLSEEQIWVNA
jgi:uncharacterized protein (DUF433 family)